jgi:hypothetical protein
MTGSSIRCAPPSSSSICFLSNDGYFARQGYDPSPLRAILPAVKPGRAPCRDWWRRVEFILGYSDTTAHLNEEIVGIRGGRIEAVWRVAARGQEPDRSLLSIGGKYTGISLWVSRPASYYLSEYPPDNFVGMRVETPAMTEQNTLRVP